MAMEDTKKIVKGKIANAITSAAKDHIVATSEDIYDEQLQKYQSDTNKSLVDNISEIKEIISDTSDLAEKVKKNTQNISLLSLKTEAVKKDVENISGSVETLSGKTLFIEGLIPDDANSKNQLADKEYVDNKIKIGNIASFRGSWISWHSVPTNSDDYLEDTSGAKTPMQGDYMIVEDASDYVAEPKINGTWRFVYQGAWNTDGKNGWKNEYCIEKKFKEITNEQIDELFPELEDGTEYIDI